MYGRSKDNISITFDEEGRIRVLDSEKFKQTKQIEEECTAFVSKLGQFNETVQKLVEMLDDSAAKIEDMKLKAIGQRNRAESAKIELKRERVNLKALILEKQNELRRYTVQLESLQQVEMEQRTLIESLSNNEA
jgi:intraflagellar transport protein 20